MKLAECKEMQLERVATRSRNSAPIYNVRKICNLPTRLSANRMINLVPRETRLVIYQLRSAVENTSRC